MDEAEDLSEVNHTELLQLARNFRADLHRCTPRDVLVEVLTCPAGEEPEVPPLRTNRYRLQLMEYVNASWDRVGALVVCPAKSRDPHECFGCTDTQVLECYYENHQAIASAKREDT